MKRRWFVTVYGSNIIAQESPGKGKQRTWSERRGGVFVVVVTTSKVAEAVAIVAVVTAAASGTRAED